MTPNSLVCSTQTLLILKTESMLAQWLEESQKASDAFTLAIRLLDDDGLLGFVETSGIEWTN